MGLFDTIGNILGLSGNDPAQGAFDINDPRFKLDPSVGSRAGARADKLYGKVGLGIDLGQANESRGQIGDALGLLRNQATGAAPSVAQNQLLENTNRGVSQLAGALAANRGLNPGQGLRALMGAGADMFRDANSQAATLRAQEMAQGQNALVNALNAVRGLDIQQAATNAQAQTQNQGLINDLLKFYEAQRAGAAGTNLNAALDLARLNTGYAQGQNAAGGAFLGNILGGAAALMGGGAMAGGAGAGAGIPLSEQISAFKIPF